MTIYILKLKLYWSSIHICGEAIKEIKEIISPKFRLLLIKRGQDQDRALRGVTNSGDIKYL